MSAPTPDAATTASKAAAAVIATEGLRVSDSPVMEPRNDPGQSSQPVTTPVLHPNLNEVKDLINQVMEAQSAVNMKMFRDLIPNQGLRVPEERRQTEYKPQRQHENRIEPKSFATMQQITGGETDYKEWSSDMETNVESVCPGFNGMLREYMEGNEAGKTPDYQQFQVDHAEIRSKEFYNLLCILTAGEAKLIIRDSGDGLKAWY